jgi:hypothetical protein
VKLRKQPGAKLAVVASMLALLGAFFALIRSDPQIGAEASAEPAKPAGNYDTFFFPGGTPTGAPSNTAPTPATAAQRPHTRTRAS